MASNWSADDLVPLRTENIDRFKRGFLRQAVCELRFPTLMELAGPKPPPAFVNALRKQYPIQELSNEVTVNFGASTDTNYAHLLRAAKGQWKVTLKTSAVTIETTVYPGFVEFRRRINEVVAAALPVIDAEFFTRVGIRYVNVVSTEGAPLPQWINPLLVGPLGYGFRRVAEFAGKLLLTVDDGGCLLQHGLRHKPELPPKLPRDYVPDYILDIDSFRNEVPVAEIDSVLAAVHTQAFSMFDWALAEKAREYLTGSKAS